MRQHDKTQIRDEVRQLRGEFAKRGLELKPVWQPTPQDPALECRQLRSLLDWVCAYERLGSRREMEKFGLLFPPVNPDCDPETDWLRFETWLHRGDLGGTWRDKIKLSQPLLPAHQLNPAQLTAVVDELVDALAQLQVEVERLDGLPDQLLYAELLRFLEEEFELLAPGTTLHLSGCDGYCPGCCRRPWCEQGLNQWQEDGEAGRMVVPPEVIPFVTTADLDLRRLDPAAGL